MLERTFHEPKFRVCCLGGLKLVETGSGTDMTPANRKTRALIGYLCIVGKPVGREQLASLLWGDRGDEQARASLRQAIYELRSLLGGDHLLKLDRDTVAAGDAVATDVAEITAAAQSGNLEQLARALSAWHGEFLQYLPSIDSSFDAWLQTERLRVHESLVDSAQEAVKAGMARGEVEPARKILRLLQQRDGTNEGVLRLGLKLDHLAGDQAALHRRYERFRALLKSELDAAPAAETQRLFQELAAGSASTANIWRSPEPSGRNGNHDARAHAEDDVSSSAGLAPVQLPDEAATRPPVPPAPTRPLRGTGLVAALAAIVFLAALGWGIWSTMHQTPPTRLGPIVVVLPFQSLSAEPGSQTFSGAIGEAVADVLSRRIRVVQTPTLPRAGAPRALVATHVLSGSVERIGNHLHVIAQLMDLEDGRVIWSHAYDTATMETPELRRALAVQISGALEKLLVSGSMAGAPPINAAAYEHYRKGRDLYLQQDAHAATLELEASIRLAPDFADAWSSLAAARWLLARNAVVQYPQGHDTAMATSARAAAERALALAPNNAEALGVLALLIPSTHLQEIDRQMERALRAEPNNAQVLGWHAEFLLYVGRNHEAFDELTRAYVLGRAAASVAIDLTLAAMKAGRFDEAREMIDLLDRNQSNGSAHELLQLHVKYFLYRHDWFGLATWLGTLPDLAAQPKDSLLRLYRDTAIALATHQAERFDPLRVRWRSETRGDPDCAVQFLAALGDPDGALAVVQSAVQSARSDSLLSDPEWEALFVPDLLGLRRDPRVPALFAQWGLSDYWRWSGHSPDFMR